MKRLPKDGVALKPGFSDTPEYRSWKAMKQRCTSPSHPAYKRYGGRGIAICDRWRFGMNGRSGFESFLSDMGPRLEGKTLDRYPNNDGNYEPSNCRWATSEQQRRSFTPGFSVHDLLRLPLSERKRAHAVLSERMKLTYQRKKQHLILSNLARSCPHQGASAPRPE
jgi:hypothetical protein